MGMELGLAPVRIRMGMVVRVILTVMVTVTFAVGLRGSRLAMDGQEAHRNGAGMGCCYHRLVAQDSMYLYNDRAYGTPRRLRFPRA
jgi:uncharacterized membrane protein